MKNCRCDRRDRRVGGKRQRNRGPPDAPNGSDMRISTPACCIAQWPPRWSMLGADPADPATKRRRCRLRSLRSLVSRPICAAPICAMRGHGRCGLPCSRLSARCALALLDYQREFALAARRAARLRRDSRRSRHRHSRFAQNADVKIFVVASVRRFALSGGLLGAAQPWLRSRSRPSSEKDLLGARRA